MMGQKTEYDFRFKKGSILCYQFFCALLVFKCSAFSSDQKCIPDFPWRVLTLDTLFSALRSIFQWSYFFKGLYYCEKPNEKSGHII